MKILLKRLGLLAALVLSWSTVSLAQPAGMGPIGDGNAIIDGAITTDNLICGAAGGHIKDCGVAPLTTLGANTVWSNPTGSTAAPTAAVMPTCANGLPLIYTPGTGFACSAAVPVILKNTNATVTYTSSGSASETLITSYAVPIGAMGANGCLRITSRWSWTNSANNKLVIIRMGSAANTSGTAMFSATQTTTANGQDIRYVCNANSAASQVQTATSFGTTPTQPGTASAIKTSSVNTAAALFYIVFSATAATSSEVVNVDGILIELIPGV